MPKAPTDPKARAIALLARREHSARELTRKLKAKGVSADEAAAAVADVAAEGWQSDSRYAEMLVRSRIGQGYGPLRIEADLRQAGLPGEAVAEALAASGADWKVQCAEAQAKKFRTLPVSGADRAKQYRFLAGRGFTASEIGAVLKGDFD